MVLRIFKAIATSGFPTALACTESVFGRGSALDPTGGAYSAPLDLLAGLRGPTTKAAGEVTKRERREREGRPPSQIPGSAPVTIEFSCAVRKQNGAFLVRQREDKANDQQNFFALSVVYNREIRHFLIRKRDDELFAIGAPKANEMVRLIAIVGRVTRWRSDKGVGLATGDRGFNSSRCTVECALDKLFTHIVQRL